MLFSMAYPLFYENRMNPLHIAGFGFMHLVIVFSIFGLFLPRWFNVFVPRNRLNDGTYPVTPGVILKRANADNDYADGVEFAIADFADSAYAKSNIAVVADGASTAELAKWTEQFFKSAPTASSGKLALNTTATKYHGGESRSAHTAGNAVVIAFPGSNYGSKSPELAVLAALLGGQSNIKWTSGFSLLSKAVGTSPGLKLATTNLGYSDAGLLTIQISGPAAAVRRAAEEAVKAIKSVSEGSVSKEDLAKAIAKASWQAGQTYNLTIEGGANHNGGSCQASLSFDGGKTFKVVKSYVGGCPPAGTSTYDFTLPDDTPAADDALFAWTWFNQVGNREMYMNCAVVSTKAGGSAKRQATSFNSRPDIL
ncbi:hypothetical protein BN1708_016119, partial [Verticillium longisporum]